MLISIGLNQIKQIKMRIEKQIEETNKRHKNQKGVFFAIRTKSNEVDYVFSENSNNKKYT